MAIEIEKMAMLKKKVATLEEREAVDTIVATLSDDFRRMIQDSRTYIMTGERAVTDVSSSVESLKRLKQLGDSYGVEFPFIQDHKQAATYLLMYGKQIIKG